jgi:hypothetical protein
MQAQKLKQTNSLPQYTDNTHPSTLNSTYTDNTRDTQESTQEKRIRQLEEKVKERKVVKKQKVLKVVDTRRITYEKMKSRKVQKRKSMDQMGGPQKKYKKEYLSDLGHQDMQYSYTLQQMIEKARRGKKNTAQRRRILNKVKARKAHHGGQNT